MARVLIVDDEPLLCEELAECLELEGFDVCQEHSVPAAMNALSDGTFDAVITDLRMPRIGGLDFIRLMNERQYAGVIIVLSGHGAEKSRQEALSNGARACLAKPVDVDDVLETLERHLSAQ